MNAAPDDRDLIDVYVAALAADDAGAALAALSADAVFQSPFHAWRGRHLPSVFHARSRAFDNVLVSSVVCGHDRAVILWNATVGGTLVEAAELVSVSDGAICRVDVYLRPAAALDVVQQAMAAAWPPKSASPDRARNPVPG